MGLSCRCQTLPSNLAVFLLNALWEINRHDTLNSRDNKTFFFCLTCELHSLLTLPTPLLLLITLCRCLPCHLHQLPLLLCTKLALAPQCSCPL